MKNLFSISFLFLFLVNISYAQTVFGVIESKDEKSALPGASVRIIGTNKGTYANRDGLFKLNLKPSENKLLIKSIGYKSKEISVNSQTDTLKIYLEPDRIVSGKAVVYGDIEPHTLIERAIAKKKQNSQKIKTVKGKLQTKLFADGTESINTFSDEETTTLSVSISTEDKKKEKPKKILMESISMTFIDKEESIYHSHILSRRQTKNIPSQVNQLVFGEFVNFYQDRISLLDVNIVSPLADDALDYYEYEILEKQILDGKYIYIVKLKPDTELYPTFDGTIMISEGDYDFVGADVSPSSHTAISFFKKIRMVEKFEKYDDNLWYPNFLQFKTTIVANVLSGALEFNVDFNATSIYSDLVLNQALPDSLYTNDVKWVTVSTEADSADSQYWQENSLFANSEEDEKIYAEIDSMVVDIDSTANDQSVAFSIEPHLSFNRSADISYGLTPSINYKDASLEYTGSYNTGLDELHSELSLTQTYFTNKFMFTGVASYFNNIGSFSDDKSGSKVLNTLQAGLFGKDYYDYYKEEGFAIGLLGNYKNISLSLGYKKTSQESIGVNTSKFIWGDKDWRDNPAISSTDFNIFNYALIMGSKGFMGMGATPYFFGIYGTVGKDEDLNKSFNTVHAEAIAKFPIFETGYNPIEFTVAAQAALASEDTPVQYQFRLQNNVIFQKNEFGLYSAPIAQYGGKELYSSNITLDFSDFLWRAIGLPTYKGRGLDISFIGSIAYTHSDKNNYYKATEAKGYMETGFHVGRIPTFFSDVVFLGFDFRKQIDGSNTGWGISISAPF